MSRVFSCDVCVIGGGPSGAVIATKLARLEHEVIVVSGPTTQRRPRVQSLSSGVLPILETLGMRHIFEAAGFLRPEAVTVQWGMTQHVNPTNLQPQGFLVDRDRLDTIFLEEATKAGAHLVLGIVAPPGQKSDSWRLNVIMADGPATIEAGFIVDATGRAGWLRKNSETKRIMVRHSPATLALHAVWSMKAQTPPQMYVEASTDCWYWAAPIDRYSVSVTVFLDPVGHGLGIKALYYARIDQSQLLRTLLSGGAPEPVHAYSASCYYDSNVAGSDWIKVGEASLCVDPLASQGVQLALSSAIHGAVVIHTLRMRPENTLAALEFYHDRQCEAYLRHTVTAVRLYDEQFNVCQNDFWRKRASTFGLSRPVAVPPDLRDWSARTRVRLSDDTQLTETPCLTGDFIEPQMALRHPNLERPLAFIDGISIALLLSHIGPDISVPGLVRQWQTLVPVDRGLKIARWLVEHQILVPCIH